MGWIRDYELFYFQLRKRKSNVLQACWHKKHDIKNCRSGGERKGKKDRASFEEREAGIFCPVGWIGFPRVGTGSGLFISIMSPKAQNMDCYYIFFDRVNKAVLVIYSTRKFSGKTVFH